MRESNFWMKVLSGVNEDNLLKNEIEKLIIESEELKKILGSIVSKLD